MKQRYTIARHIISSRLIRQKYLSSICRRLFNIPRYKDIENEPYIIDNFYGLKFHGELQSYIEWEVFFHGAFDRNGLEFTRKILNRLTNPTCIDIGANVGVYSIFMSKYALDIHAFEPLPRNYEILKKNVELNSLKNIKIYTHGLSNENKMGSFHINNSSNHGAGSFDANHQNRIKDGGTQLELKTGDSVLSECEKIDFIKMDIEGFEFQAIQGLQLTLNKHRPILMMEYNETTQQNFHSYEDMVNAFPDNYKIRGIELYKFPNLKRFFDTEHLHTAPFDFHKNYSQIIAFPEEIELNGI